NRGRQRRRTRTRQGARSRTRPQRTRPPLAIRTRTESVALHKRRGRGPGFFRAPAPLGRWIPIYGRGARSAGTSGSGRRRIRIGDRSGFAQVRRSRLSGWRDQERDRIGCGDRPGGDQGNREPPLAHYPHLTILLPEALWSTARANAVRARNAEQRHSRALEEGGATAALQDCELAEVRRDAAAKHVEIVAALQQRDDASVGVLPRDLPDEGRDPGVVGFEQAQKRHPVVAMRVEAG